MSSNRSKQFTGSDFRKLESILADLKAIKREILPNEVDVAREAELKDMDDYQRKKHNLTIFLQELHKDIDTLVEMKRSLGEGKDRNADTIRLESANRKRLQEAEQRFQIVKAAMLKDVERFEKKKSDALDAAEIDARKQMVAVFAKEIQDLIGKNSRVRPLVSSAEEAAQESRRAARAERKRAQRDREARRARRRGGSSAADNEPDEPEAAPMSDEEKQFMQEYDTAIAEQDELLDEISKGMDELKQLGLDMNKTLTLQQHLLNSMENKVNTNIQKLKTANSRMKDILKETGGMGLWCPRIMCLVILLALLVYIFKLV